MSMYVFNINMVGASNRFTVNTWYASLKGAEMQHAWTPQKHFLDRLYRYRIFTKLFAAEGIYFDDEYKYIALIISRNTCSLSLVDLS